MATIQQKLMTTSQWGAKKTNVPVFARFKCTIRYKSWARASYPSFDYVKTCNKGVWSKAYSEIAGYTKLLAMLHRKKGEYHSASIFASGNNNIRYADADYNVYVITIYDNGKETGPLNGLPIRPLPFNEVTNKLDLEQIALLLNR